MFLIDCPRHASRVMVTETRIRELCNTAAGIHVHVECWCGERVTVRTGRRLAATLSAGLPGGPAHSPWEPDPGRPTTGPPGRYAAAA